MSGKNFLSKTSRVIALCSIANFINAADRIIMPIAIVPMTDRFHWNLNVQGWILSSFACGYFTSQVCWFLLEKKVAQCFRVNSNSLFQIIGACAAQKLGGKAVLFFAVSLWSLSTVITPLCADSIPILIICRLLLGLGEGLGELR